jgi:hypothetical protein
MLQVTIVAWKSQDTAELEEYIESLGIKKPIVIKRDQEDFLEAVLEVWHSRIPTMEVSPENLPFVVLEDFQPYKKSSVHWSSYSPNLADIEGAHREATKK